MPLRSVAGLFLLAGVMELLQNLSPGRDPQIVGWLASGGGALVGGTVGYLIRRRLERTNTQRRA
jgi:VanZ family protein